MDPDGRELLVTRRDFKTRGTNVAVVPLDGGNERVVLETPANEFDAHFSPDGRWLTYVSDENGQHDVYLQRVPSTGQKWRVSPRGGVSPTWNSTSRELFYAWLRFDT